MSFASLSIAYTHPAVTHWSRYKGTQAKPPHTCIWRDIDSHTSLSGPVDGKKSENRSSSNTAAAVTTLDPPVLALLTPRTPWQQRVRETHQLVNMVRCKRAPTDETLHRCVGFHVAQHALQRLRVTHCNIHARPALKRRFARLAVFLR